MGESVRLIIMLKDSDDAYHLSDVTISNNGRILANEAVLDLQIYNVTSIENWHVKFSNDLNKYRSFLSMYQDYLFDYDTETGNFSIYLYLGSKSTPFIQCTMEEFYEKVTRHYQKPKDLTEFETFYRHVKKADENFSLSLNLPSLKDFSVKDRFHINGKVIYKNSMAPVVIGIIKHVAKDDNATIPYYATKEGKDPATGLLNKRASSEYTTDILNMNDGQNHYMIMIDADNFKDINDTYGHLFGDEVLLKVASIISSTVNGRGICGRFGGDEFYIFTTNIRNEQQLRNMLTTMRKKIYYAFDGIMEDFHLTLSIGISLYPDDGSEYDELFKKADKCLYLAKNKGKNRFIIYDEKLHGGILDDSSLLRRTFNPLEKAEYLAGVTADVGAGVVSGDLSKIPELLEYIRSSFELDGIRIYSKNNKSLMYQCGSYKKIPSYEEFAKNGEFLTFYNVNQILTIGSLPSFESNDREFSRAMASNNIMATLTMHFTNKEGDDLFFFYDIFNRSIRWNESDKNYLLTISKMLSLIL